MESQRGCPLRPSDAGGHRQGSGNGPGLHAAALNGDDLHGGRRRRAPRSSRSEGHGPEEGGPCPEGFGPLHGARGEIVWFNSNMYEQAESYFQSTLGPAFGASQSSPHSSSSSPGERVHRSLVFRAKRKPPQQIEGRGSAELRPHPRSSSEPQRGRQGPRGGRKRVFSETERAPQRARDNISMSGLQALAHDAVWFDKSKYDEAERRFYESQNGVPQAPQDTDASAILQDIAKARQTVQQSLAGTAPAPNNKVVVKEEEDDDIDLFASDEEDEEAERIKAQRVQEYTARKAAKPVLIAKSSILLDVKPWDDETDMAKLEECVRSVQMDGLLWGASKLVPVGYGIKKLQINCVVEDDKVGTDILEEEITKFEDFVQSVDVAAFNKI
ncbi:eukaryotic translation elongation factor 1 delta a (guanine nucleotide exchange protein) isoform X5 [Brachyhypopomus gauderio]|uniref:eukaryotic translation elongation factor 1 delta a (guanine nucleotide exchange protein) isoform X5 n=1 Tax=Brachyhypopomus gauderio TaxID=698409 RepID=UPI004042FD35